MTQILNWFSLHFSVLALGYLIGGLRGTLIALIGFEGLKFVINIIPNPRSPKLK